MDDRWIMEEGRRILTKDPWELRPVIQEQAEAQSAVRMIRQAYEKGKQSGQGGPSMARFNVAVDAFGRAMDILKQGRHVFMNEPLDEQGYVQKATATAVIVFLENLVGQAVNVAYALGGLVQR